MRQRAHLLAARFRQRRLPFAARHPLRRPGEPLDGLRDRPADDQRHQSRGDGEDERQQRHLGRHVAQELHHAEGCLAHAHQSAAGDARLGRDARHSRARFARLDQHPPLRVENRHVGVDGAVGESLQDRPQRLGRRAHRQLGDGARFVLGGAQGKERGPRSEAIDDDAGEHRRENQRRRSERNEDLQPQRQTGAPRLDQPRHRRADAEQEEQRQRHHQLALGHPLSRRR